VLVVEDEPVIAELLRSSLTREGYAVLVAGDGVEGLLAVQRDRPAAVILDVGLPGIDGTEVCRRLRAAGDWTPVLFVTARDDEVDRVLGLELGADDYVTKPFSPREVTSRVRAVLRRHAVPGSGSAATTGGMATAIGATGATGTAGTGATGTAGTGATATAATRPDGYDPNGYDPAGTGPAASAPPLQVGRLSLDAGARRVRLAGEVLEVTTTEFDLLRYLMQRPGRVATRDELLDRVWGYPAGTQTRTVDVHVAQLRAKLGTGARLRTVRGVGYSIEPG
jgi:DNA-binding response OmpR family regulator